MSSADDLPAEPAVAAVHDSTDSSPATVSSSSTSRHSAVTASSPPSASASATAQTQPAQATASNQSQPVVRPPARAAAAVASTRARAPAPSSLAGQWAVASDSGATVTLLHRVPHVPQPGAGPQPFWANFVDKCRRAWDIMRPDTPPPVLAPAAVVRNRLQMILVADRCGMLPADLLVLKERTLASLADQLDAEGFSEMEMCVSATKANGERLTISMPLSTMPGSLNATRNRDEQLYDYEVGRTAYGVGSKDDLIEQDEGEDEGEEYYDSYSVAAHEVGEGRG